jgi:2-keto-4-pentenoate hydratase/2-oxohepta-3-ene-1,7-dioic acid hydratase in catechol pathway
MKFPNSLAGPGNVRIPTFIGNSDPGQLDYEGELAVIIGKGGRNIPEDKALSHVLGYAASNDVSARTLQMTNNFGQW